MMINEVQNEADLIALAAVTELRSQNVNDNNDTINFIPLALISP